MTDDSTLDAASRQILADLEDVKRLEESKRRMARSTPEFHETADAVEEAARRVFEHAHSETVMAEEDSPIPAERLEQVPGDWTRPPED